MSQSPSGKKLLCFKRFGLHNVAMALPYLLYWLPDGAKKFLIRRNVGSLSPECVVTAGMHLFDWNVVKNVLRMAHNELDTVRELPVDLIQENLKSLVFYYGMDDGWCPVEYGRKLEERFPEAKVVFCDSGCEHAFVLESGHVIADKVAAMIERD